MRSAVWFVRRLALVAGWDAGCCESDFTGPVGGADGIPECLVAADCNGGDEWTIDACANGMCENPTAENGFF